MAHWRRFVAPAPSRIARFLAAILFVTDAPMRLVFSDNPSFADLGWFGLLLLAVLLGLVGLCAWLVLALFG